MTVAFWILAVLVRSQPRTTVNCASGASLARKPVYSVAGLLAHFLFLAITYFMLSAEFLAVIQLIVYSGAILMLFVFVIALLSSGVAPFAVGPDRLPKIAAPAIAVIAILLGFVAYAALRHYLPGEPPRPRASHGVFDELLRRGPAIAGGRVRVEVDQRRARGRLVWRARRARLAAMPAP